MSVPPTNEIRTQATTFSYFNHSYLINLASDADRLARVSARLSRLGVPFERFAALPPPKADARYWDPHLKAGIAGCAASHRAVLQLILDRGQERALIFEDDVVLRDDAAQWMERIVPQLAVVGWDVFYLGLHLMEDGGPISANLGRVGKGFHAHAYAVTRRAIPRLIDYIDRSMEAGAGTFDAFAHPELFKVYATPILAVQEPNFSHSYGKMMDRLPQYFQVFDGEDFLKNCAEARGWGSKGAGVSGGQECPPETDRNVCPTAANASAEGEAGTIAGPAEALPLTIGELPVRRAMAKARVEADARRALEHQRGGKTAEAQKLWEKILAEEPEHPAALHYTGILAHQRGQPALAVDLLFRSLAADPDCAEFHNNLAILLGEGGRGDEALELIDEAIRLKDDYPEAHCNRGVVLEKLGRMDDAMASWARAVEIKPDYPDGHSRLGSFLLKQGNPLLAAEHLGHAARLRPRHPETRLMLGNALREAGDLRAAAASYRTALELRPGWAEAYCNLGAALHESGSCEEAQAALTKAISLKGDAIDAHWNFALALLSSGQFERGWLEYEWRRLLKDQAGGARRFIQPEWNGMDVAGRTVLVLCEQGLGDTLQFIRYAPLLARRGAKVLVECQPKLRPLLTGMEGVEQVIARGEPLPAFDVHVRLLSLPGIFHTRVETVPAQVPYLHADEARAARWKKAMGPGGFNVGIAWQGNTGYAGDRLRSIALEHFAPLAQVPGVRLWSLQKGKGTEQIPEAGFAVHQFEGPMDEEVGAFIDTSAVMRGLDLVVSSDTSVPHLAGALGAPVWLALPYAADWRWLREREDSPWYPTMRLFRQRVPGDWPGLFERMADALRQKVGAAGRATPAEPVMAPVPPGQLLDRIAILQIKVRYLTDTGKLRGVQAELEALWAARDAAVPRCDELDILERELREVNEALWRIEDELRLCEASGEFGARFTELARSVYRTNDRRAALKRQIDTLLGSPFVEEKQYAGSV
jgi:tetratricopeptide (TPR) repeat protein/GR25 family glycosyltransferase involved in LPS biosynthesis